MGSMDGEILLKTAVLRPQRRPAAARDPDLAELSRLIKTLCRRSERLSESVDSLADWLDRWEHGGKGDLGLQRQRRPPPVAGYPSADADEFGRKLARLGVTVDIVRETDDWATVTIDKSRKLRLSPALADLLEVLCEDTGLASDGLVGWKSMAELARGLQKQTGKDISTRTITVRLSRLRDALEGSGLNKQLVQTGRKGYRFARKAKVCPETSGNMT
jgi:DNA-binding response OmpR family regulator